MTILFIRSINILISNLLFSPIYSKSTILHRQLNPFPNTHNRRHFVLILLLQVLHMIPISTHSIIKLVLHQLVPYKIILPNFYITHPKLFPTLLLPKINHHKILCRKYRLQICALNITVIPCYICNIAQFPILLFPSLVPVSSYTYRSKCFCRYICK